MQAWQVVRHGRPSEALVLRELPVPEPGPGQLRVAVARTTANFNEVDGCHGRYRTIDPPLPYTLGMEMLGTVEAAGPGAERWLGRRVVATAAGAFGAHAERAVADAAMTFDAPELPDDQAAAVFFPFHVAHLSLFERGGLRAGETLLVHSGAGGVGSAALQLGAACGARVFATASTPEKRELCRRLGAELALDPQGDFATALLDATEGRGVDVVCDLVGGELARRTFPAVAFGGRHMMAGFSGGIEAEDESLTPRPVLFGNFALAGVLLAYQDDPRPAKRAVGMNAVPRAVGEALHAHLLELLARGAVRPWVGRVDAFTALPAVLEAMEERRTTGRNVLVWPG